MKNIKYVIIVAGLLLGLLSVPVSAVNTTTDATTTAAQLQQLILSLQQQIATLQAQIQALNQARSQVQETAKDVSTTFRLISQLRLGMTGADVTLLQQILATDPTIYPEGLITGRYGKLTEKAVKRFQERTCLGQVGNVGPKTLAKINELLTEGAGKSGKIPPGLLTAPGIQKKLCATATSTPTTTPDVTPPVMSAIVATGISSTSATITWTTNEQADSKVYYGSVNPLVITTGTASVGSSVLTLSHSLTITGLTPNTTYYYLVSSVDASGNKALDTQKSFTTLSGADITPPVISGVTVTGIASTSASITWTTDEQADSTIYYGSVTPLVITTSTASVGSSTLTLSHSLTITGLTPYTRYYFEASSIDAFGNKAIDTEKSFITPSE